MGSRAHLQDPAGRSLHLLRSQKRPTCARVVRDEQLKTEIRRVYDANFMAYGADKVWAQLNDDGIRVARLHRRAAHAHHGPDRGDQGEPVQADDHDRRRRGSSSAGPGRAAVPGAGPEPALGGRPHRQDAHRVGVRGVHHRRVQPLRRRLARVTIAAIRPRHRRPRDGDLEPPTRRRRPGGPGPSLGPGRAQGYLSIRYSDRLDENDIVASVGSKGDSYDNALAESFHGLYKWELIYRHGPWRGLDDVEFATLGYVDWFNHRRFHGGIIDGPRFTTPAAFETDHYRQSVTAVEAATQ